MLFSLRRLPAVSSFLHQSVRIDHALPWVISFCSFHFESSDSILIYKIVICMLILNVGVLIY